jgi:hypothetical protein
VNGFVAIYIFVGTVNHAGLIANMLANECWGVALNATGIAFSIGLGYLLWDTPAKKYEKKLTEDQRRRLIRFVEQGGLDRDL